MARLTTERRPPEQLLKDEREKLFHTTRTIEDLALAQIRQPDDASIAQQLTTANRDRAAIEQAIANLNAAINGLNREAGITKAVDHDKQIAELAAVALSTTAEMDALLPKIVAQVEDINSPMVRFVNLGAQRQQAMHALQRLTGKKYGNRMLRVDGHQALSDALLGALIRSGFANGVACPSLAPHVVISTPYRVPTLEDAQRTAANDRTRVVELIEEAMQPAQPAAQEI
ncbi:MAG: hypothetical protein KA207_02815 [Burkholderiaceae bacterium]|nr:hypothetical protein [Burkholderiaceae bacterium]